MRDSHEIDEALARPLPRNGELHPAIERRARRDDEQALERKPRRVWKRLGDALDVRPAVLLADPLPVLGQAVLELFRKRDHLLGLALEISLVAHAELERVPWLAGHPL